VPNQAFVWAMDGIPFETYFAVPAPDSTNYLRHIAPTLISILNAPMEAWPIRCEAQWTNDEIRVSGNPFFGPFLEAVREPAGDFLNGGIFPKLDLTGGMTSKETHSNSPPTGLISEIMSRTNLVCYDWEITAARVIQWRALSQLSLIMADKPITVPDTIAQNGLTQ